MKKIKVFALPSHQTVERTSGVDYLRIISPMTHLAKHPDFDVTIWNQSMDIEWPEVAKKYDIIFFSYLNNPWGYATMACMARKYGKKLIMDIDDALPYIKRDNVAYEVFKPGGEGLKTVMAIARDVDHVTVTNRYLRNIISRHCDKPTTEITAIDNYIDLNVYTYRPKFKDTYDVTITHFGSTTHFNDIQYPAFTKAIERLMGEYPNLKLYTVGSFFGDLKMKYGMRYEQGFGDVDIYKWINEKYPSVMDKTDIVVAPLVPDTYNTAKSGTKFFEYSSSSKPGVYQKLPSYMEYVNHGVNGYVCTYEHEWYDSLKKLIDDKEHRRKVGEEAYKTACDNTIEKHVEEYSTLFKKVLDKH